MDAGGGSVADVFRRLRAEAVDEAPLIRLGVDPDDRHVLAREEPLDRPGPFEDLQGRPDGRVPQLDPGPLADLVVRQLDRVGVEAAEVVVDPVDDVARGVLVLDEDLLEKTLEKRMAIRPAGIPGARRRVCRPRRAVR